jgi:hypothetical protein
MARTFVTTFLACILGLVAGCRDDAAEQNPSASSGPAAPASPRSNKGLRPSQGKASEPVMQPTP